MGESIALFSLLLPSCQVFFYFPSLCLFLLFCQVTPDTNLDELTLCQDLHAIDSLWVKYSNGRFGFSVQNQIYKSCKGNRFFRDSIENEFGDIVGWRPGARWLNDYNNITFDLTAPVGHLPVKGGWYWGRRTWELFKNVKFSVYLSCYVGCNLFSRLDSCEL